MERSTVLRSARRAGLCLLLALSLWAIPGRAQSTVTGVVAQEDGPLAYATVRLLVAADSAFAGGAVADDDGRFAVEAVAPGTYVLRVSMVGYREHRSAPFTVAASAEEHRLDPVVLAADVVALDEVAVAARRLVFEQRGDRLVVNVSRSATLAGTSVLDVLERSPGVVVNRQQGTVSMLGKDGVRVLVDGRPSYVPADGLVSFLAGLSTDRVASVELVTAPPAEYDAEGNAGFINVVLKGQPGGGVKGSLTASGGYGEGELGSASTSIQYRQGRLSLAGSYAFSWDGRAQTFDSYRRLFDAGTTVETPTASSREPVQRNHDARLRLDYALTGRTTLGALVAGYDNRWSMDALNTAVVHHDGLAATRIESANAEVNHWRHAMANVNVRHDFGDGRSGSVDLDYLRYHNDNPTTYRNASTDVGSGEATEETLESGKVTPLRILVAKADYRTTEVDGWTMSGGVKGAFSRFTNDPTFVSLVEPAWVDGAGIGVESTLREDVLAAYGTVRYTPTEATTLEAGLRYEHTGSLLRDETGADLVDRRYGGLFPSVNVSHGLRDDLRLGASYVRRITRPTFNDMAPFIYFLNPFTFFTGSTAVQPATLNALKADATYRSVLASVQYAWEDASIAQFQNRVLPEANVQIFFPTNLDATRTATGLLSVPVTLTGWWSAQNSATVTRMEAEGTTDGTAWSVDQTTYQISSTHNVRLRPSLAFEAAGSYQSTALFGAARFEPVWSVDLGLGWTLPGEAGKLTFAVDDVFDSMEWSFVEGAPGDAFYTKTVFDGFNRTFRLTYTRSFGTGEGVEARSTASEAEAGRVQQ